MFRDNNVDTLIWESRLIGYWSQFEEGGPDQKDMSDQTDTDKVVPFEEISGDRTTLSYEQHFTKKQWDLHWWTEEKEPF